MKKSETVDLVKSSIGFRLSYLINALIMDFSNKQLAQALGISVGTLYKIRKDQHQKMSLNLLLSVVERLGIKYKTVVEFNGKTRKVTVTGMETAVGIQYKGTLRANRVVLQRL